MGAWLVLGTIAAGGGVGVGAAGTNGAGVVTGLIVVGVALGTAAGMAAAAGTKEAGVVTGLIVAELAPEASTVGDFFLYTSK